MPDKVYEWLEQFQIFMDRGSFTDLLLVVFFATLGSPLLIFVHELGHAVAVRARGLPLHTLRVGDGATVAITAGNFRMELGRLLGKGDVGGYVRYDGRTASPLDVLVISLAGPAANVVGAAVSLWLATAMWSHGVVSVMLWLHTLGGVSVAAANLRLRGVAHDPLRWSDGLWARAAWHGVRAGAGAAPMWRDPHEGFSVPPPQAGPS
jgi:Peptidase family M50